MLPKPHVCFVWLIFTIIAMVLATTYLSITQPSILPQSFRKANHCPNNSLKGYHNTFSHTQKEASIYQWMYDDVTCIMERSENTCSFPLLTDYHRRCGRFPASVSWENLTAGYPETVMSADICKLPPIESAAERLQQYIEERNISSIVTFGDSQGNLYTNALIAIFKQASYECNMTKAEPSGNQVYLNYFTEGSSFNTTARIPRTCRTCNSHLYVCSDKQGRTVQLEYLSLIITARAELHLNQSECNHTGTKHPLCSVSTLPQYVFQHYLNRQSNYPQLLLLFSGFAHDTNRPLGDVYNELQWIYSVIAAHVPASSALIWYGAPSWHAKKAVNRKLWFTFEGNGYNPLEKMRAENQFLALLQSQHHRSRKSPPMFSFFDLYQMQEQLLDVWDIDHVHSKPSWYHYVMGHTANMLPSLPILNKSLVKF